MHKSPPCFSTGGLKNCSLKPETNNYFFFRPNIKFSPSSNWYVLTAFLLLVWHFTPLLRSEKTWRGTSKCPFFFSAKRPNLSGSVEQQQQGQSASVRSSFQYENNTRPGTATNQPNTRPGFSATRTGQGKFARLSPICYKDINMGHDKYNEASQMHYIGLNLFCSDVFCFEDKCKKWPRSVTMPLSWPFSLEYVNSLLLMVSPLGSSTGLLAQGTVIQTENSTPRYTLLDWRQGISV